MGAGLRKGRTDGAGTTVAVGMGMGLSTEGAAGPEVVVASDASFRAGFAAEPPAPAFPRRSEKLLAGELLLTHAVSISAYPNAAVRARGAERVDSAHRGDFIMLQMEVGHCTNSDAFCEACLYLVDEFRVVLEKAIGNLWMRFDDEVLDVGLGKLAHEFADDIIGHRDG